MFRINHVPTIVLAALTLTLACETPEPETPFTLELTAVSDRGDALEGVEFSATDHELGHTGADGLLMAEIAQPPGSAINLTATCPAGYRSPERPTRLLLQEHRSLDGSTSERHLKRTIECQAEERGFALVVSAEAASSLPILVNGEPWGSLDSAGMQQLVFSGEPGTSVQLTLDTESQPKLQPKSPSFTVTIGNDDDIGSWTPEFKKERPKRRVRRRGRQQPKRHIPYRLN